MSILYLIATPIGNLQDISLRALSVLQQTPLIAAEDTRHARRLLTAHNIGGKKYLSLRAHNENQAATTIIRHLAAGDNAVYLSDAGAPAISDPGARLVQAVRTAGEEISPIPGASALTALISAAGAADGALHFFGFAPRSAVARREFFANLPTFAGNIVLFESPRRIAGTISLLHDNFGDETKAVIGRELTKLHEQIIALPLAQMVTAFANGTIPQRGEFSLLIESVGISPLAAAGQQLFEALAKELPPRKAAALAARFSGESAAEYYRRHLAAKEK
ncbi:MAG: 16S rRNA (cytidine(1402)-2'-O)-methyltransferase [Gammaproteobacteria bacterium WSBS_2016_MAG_OTU1]